MVQYSIIAVFIRRLDPQMQHNNVNSGLQTPSHLLVIPSAPLPSPIHKSSPSSMRENVIRQPDPGNVCTY